MIKAAEKYEWAFVVESPAIRRTIAQLDSGPAPIAAESGGFALVPARPAASVSAAASSAP